LIRGVRESLRRKDLKTQVGQLIFIDTAIFIDISKGTSKPRRRSFVADRRCAGGAWPMHAVVAAELIVGV